MENEEVIVVQNEGNKGNPNHKPAGSPDGGQFTSGKEAGGSSSVDLKSNLLNFIKSKQAQAEPVAAPQPKPVSFDAILSCFGVGCTLNKENMKTCFEAGIYEAQVIISNFFKQTGTKIYNCKPNKCAHWSSFFQHICFQQCDLKEVGKHAGGYEVGETFYHEIFHAMDDRYGTGANLTTSFKLSNGKTLKQTFHDEIATKKYSWNMNLYNEVKADFAKAQDEELHKMFTEEQIQEYKNKEQYFRKAMTDLNNSFDNHLYNYPSVQAYNEAFNNYKAEFKKLKKGWQEVNDIMLPAYQKARHKYSCLSDFCSFIYRTGVGNESICGGHTKKYWSMDGGNKAIYEMWAELGSMWARGRTDNIERMRKYFPDTVKGFEELVGKLETIRENKYGL